jgi:hypothetical protein
MLGVSVFLTVAVAVQAVFGSPVQSRTAYAVKETHRVPRKWVKMGRAPADKMLNLQIGVKQGQFGELERHLYEGVFYSSIEATENVMEALKLTETNLQSLIRATLAMAR